MPKRPRSHVIADLSVNFLEHKVVCRGHAFHRIDGNLDYGTDGFMEPYSRDTEQRDGLPVRFQVKATNKPVLVDDDRFTVCRVKSAHLRDWINVDEHPFILVLFDARKVQAYWLDIQACANTIRISHDDEDESTQTVSLRIPISNRLTVKAIDKFHRMAVSRKRELQASLKAYRRKI